ncbi:MAG: dTDP-4-dehydrorhamnose 3,5-epimerase [Gammaproteobacteria bacterium]|nr:dTDP-4-dehydrorhamnose 3,5-epimerase [Gammaproteobacteria bacterium]
MKVIKTPIQGLMVVESELHSDRRGEFARFYCKDELQEWIGSYNILQINHSHTHAVGAIRGLHYQNPPYTEIKFVRCLKGRVWDVAVDLRAGSPTQLQWHAEELSEANLRMMVIPQGFAHGFQVLESDSELLYLHTAFFTPDAEGGIAHDDPQLAITWPLPVTEMSDRDQQLSPISPSFPGIDT